jgi:VWFA-related protein
MALVSLQPRASGDSQDRPAVFRARTDLIKVDVTVLDRDRKPVSGLTAADFTVLENGKPRLIQAFSAVDLPAPSPASVPQVAWRTEVPPDVVSNQISPARIVVLIIDDASVVGGGSATSGSWAVRKVRETARTLIDGLDPTDLAAVVFTFNNRSAQSLTLDRRRLRLAIEQSALFPGSSADDDAGDAGDGEVRVDPASRTGVCPCGLCSLRSLRQVTEALRSFPDRKKEIIFISRGIAMNPASPCYPEQARLFTEAMRFAQAGNVAIHPMDPAGLLTNAVTAQSRLTVAPRTLVSSIDPKIEFLRTLSDHTGTRAVVNNNDPDRQVSRILEESRHYYLLGFVPADLTPDGKKRKIEVKVSRKGVDVRARNGYYPAVPTPTEASTLPAAEGAVQSLLPQSDIALQVSLTAVAGTAGPEVAAVLGVTRGTNTGDAPVTSPEEVEIVAQMLDQYGLRRGIERKNIRVVSKNGPDGVGYYELLSRLPAKPGRYEIRFGVSSRAQTGSVYGYVEVPDFARDRLAVSGWAVAAAPGPVQAPAEVFAELMPVAPTSRRTFSVRDSLRGWLRIYQRGQSVPLPVTLEMTVLDTAGTIRMSDTRSFAPETFAADRSVDYLCPVPVNHGPGEYLLDAIIRAGQVSEKRSVRYTVR